MSFDWTPHKGGRWKAEHVGDSIQGRVTNIEERDYQGKTKIVVSLRDPDGVNREVTLTTDLLDKFSELEVQRGDAVLITLKELRATGQPQKFKVFEVKHKRASELDGGSTRATNPQDREPPAQKLDPDPSKWTQDMEEPF